MKLDYEYKLMNGKKKASSGVYWPTPSTTSVQMAFDTGCGIWEGSTGGVGGSCLRLSKRENCIIV